MSVRRLIENLEGELEQQLESSRRAHNLRNEVDELQNLSASGRREVGQTPNPQGEPNHRNPKP